jgi:hypothetical protein
VAIQSLDKKKGVEIMRMSMDSISSNVNVDPPRIIIYGIGGIGKTTFGASAPQPIFAMTEKGKGRLQVASFPQIQSWTDGIEAISTLLSEPHDYETLVWDSLDWWEPHIWKYVCEQAGKKNIEDFGYGKGYTYAEDSWNIFFRGLNALQEQRGMSIILTAHAEVKRFDSPEVEPYDRYQIKLHKRAAELASEWADIIFFANWEVFTVKTEVGFKKTVNRGTGSGRRILYSEERPAFKAKNRYGLPPRIELTTPFDWAGFINFISNGNVPITAPTDSTEGE